MVSARLAASHLQRHRMNLIEGVTGPFVNALNGIGRVRLRQAVDQPTVRVRPSLLEYDSFVTLYGKVGVVSRRKTFGGNADHSPVDVHELRHVHHLLAYMRALTVRQIGPKPQGPLVGGAALLAPALPPPHHAYLAKSVPICL
jgi:hypothetical protein